MKIWTPLTEVGDFSPAGASIYAAAISPPVMVGHVEPVDHRVAVLWDEDRDERVLTFLAHVYFAAPETFLKISAIREGKGAVTVWAANTQKDDHAALGRAASSEHIQDTWPVEVRSLWLGDKYRSGGLLDDVLDLTGGEPIHHGAQDLDVFDLVVVRAHAFVGLGWWSIAR